MATYNKFYAFTEHLAEGVHKLGTDQLIVALTSGANPPLVTNTVLANLTQINYANLSTRNLVVASSAQAGGLYRLILNDLILSASGNVAPFRYVVVYNDVPTSPLKPLLGWYDYGSDATLGPSETFTVNFDQGIGFIAVA